MLSDCSNGIDTYVKLFNLISYIYQIFVINEQDIIFNAFEISTTTNKTVGLNLA